MEYGKYYGRFNMIDRFTGEVFSSDSLRPLYQIAYSKAREAAKSDRTFYITIFQGTKLKMTIGTNVIGTPKKVIILK